MIAKKILKNLRAFVAKNTWERKAVWLLADFPEYVRQNGACLDFYKFNICVPVNKYEFVLDGFEYLKDLYESKSFEFYVDGEILYAKGCGIVVQITTTEELFILKEIFIARDYNFKGKSNVVVVDIGMNVGFASLYFASRDDVVHVYGYEPFVPTYLQSSKNIDFNTDLSAKITKNNFGLSNIEKTIEVDYDFENKGQVGICGTQLVKVPSRSQHKEMIKLRPALAEIKKIIDRHPGFDLILKIDCEGAEYDIFDSFSETGIPEAVKLVMMEWHQKGPDQLMNILVGNGFCGVATYTYRNDVGMIYASRGCL